MTRIADVVTAAKGLHPAIHVIGIEPEAGDDTQRFADLYAPCFP